MKKGGAAKGELVLAIFELANCFRHGWGIPKDSVAAKQVSGHQSYHNHLYALPCLALQSAADNVQYLPKGERRFQLANVRWVEHDQYYETAANLGDTGKFLAQ